MLFWFGVAILVSVHAFLAMNSFAILRDRKTSWDTGDMKFIMALQAALVGIAAIGLVIMLGAR